MREYEMVLVVQPELEGEGVNALVGQVSQTITGRGGQVTQVGQLIDNSGQVSGIETWKRRKLAYPIRHQREGYYPVLRMQAGSEVLSELDRSLKLNENVLRYLIVRVDES
jgi:small subunit ribosomal protein S6